MPATDDRALRNRGGKMTVVRSKRSSSNGSNGVTRAAVDPLCVEYQDNEGDDSQRGWCLAHGGPDKDLVQQRTGCAKYVVFPGSYSRRKPTCPECLEAMAQGAMFKAAPNATALLA